MAKVFVSYSRKDIEFAKRLTAELKKSDLDFWIDWEGIPPTVDWWKEIEKGIEEADAFLFLISPDSAKSKVCEQEIDCAVKNGKRLLPLVVRDIQGTETPPQLRHLNWIFFRESDNFEAALAKLLAALHTDFEWVQAHRELQVKALEWERRKREKSFLLHGEELNQAEYQLNTHTAKEPHPTALQQEYLSASRKAADRQRRTTTSLVAIVIVALAALAVFGFVQAGAARTAQANAEVNLYAAQTAQVDAQQKQRQADDNAATAEANANAAATAQAKALASANVAATAQAVAENARAEIALANLRMQLVIGYRAQALASFSQKVGDRTSPLAALLAAEAYKTAANSATVTRLFELLQTDLIVNRFEARNGVYVIAFSPQGDQLAAGYNSGREALKLWPVTTSAGIAVPLSGHQNAVYGAAFSPDGQTLASADFNGQVIIWDVASRQPRGNPLDSGGKKLFSLAFNPTNPDMFVTGGEAGIVTIWDAATGQIVNELPGHNDTINSLAFSPDGKWLASGDGQGMLFVWDTSTFEMAGMPTKAHTSPLLHLTYSPDGQMLATGDDNGEISIWQMSPRPQLFKTQPQQTRRISTLAFSPNGQWLASGSYDSQVLLWDTTTFELITRLPTTDKSEVYSVAFSPDGSLLAIGNKSGAVTVWNMQPSFWLTQICTLTKGATFTQSQWDQYFPGEAYRSDICQ